MLDAIRRKISSIRMPFWDRAEYHIEKDRVIIDFFIVGFSKKLIVKIFFDELENIEHIPRLSLKSVTLNTYTYINQFPYMDEMKGWLDFLHEKTDRPAVVLRHAFTGANGEFILLKGPKICYLLPFDTKDPSDLVNAFNAYKKRAQKPL